MSLNDLEIEILRKIAKGSWSFQSISQELNVPVSHVKMAVKDLVMKGYLRRIECAKENCTKCPLRKTCPFSYAPLNVVTYVITEKGIRAIEKRFSK